MAYVRPGVTTATHRSGTDESRRALLFGNSGGGSAVTEQMEQDNDARVDRLTGGVQALKEVAIQIGSEVTAQNAMLDSMSTGFDSAGGVLRSTMGRLKGLADGGSASHLIILVVAVVAVLFFAAYFLR